MGLSDSLWLVLIKLCFEHQQFPNLFCKARCKVVKPAAKKGRSGPLHPRRGERHGPGEGLASQVRKLHRLHFNVARPTPNIHLNTFEYIAGT